MQKIDNILALYGLRKGPFQHSRDFNNAAAYAFLMRVLTPIEMWPAYTLGVIDLNGNILISRKQMTYDQENSFTKLDLVALRFKKALEQTPRGTLLARMPPQTLASMLLKESEVPTNVTGTGNIAQYEPPLGVYVLKRRALERKRKKDERV